MEPSNNNKISSQPAFKSAHSAHKQTQKAAKAQGSQMVRATQLGLHDGPKPPGIAHAAIKRDQFNKDWRQEYRNALKIEKGRRMYQSFTQNAQQSRSI